MQKVVRERDEQAYCSCRDIASREASVQLSLMVSNPYQVYLHRHTSMRITALSSDSY